MRTAKQARPVVPLTTQYPPFQQPSPSIASALGRYEESQSGFTILPESARHAVLEIGDRMQGLQGALRPVEPGDGDLGTDYASESLRCWRQDALRSRCSTRTPARSSTRASGSRPLPRRPASR